jgi:hypothetical protein
MNKHPNLFDFPDFFILLGLAPTKFKAAVTSGVRI